MPVHESPVPCSLGIAADVALRITPKLLQEFHLNKEHQLAVHHTPTIISLIITEKELHSSLEFPGLGFTLGHRSTEDAPKEFPTFPPWASGAATPADGEADKLRIPFLLETFILSDFCLLP